MGSRSNARPACLAWRLGVLALALALGGGSFATGCRRQQAAPPPPPPPKPILGSVTVDDLTPPDDRPATLDTKVLERELRERLVATGLFDTKAAEGDAGRVATRVAIGVAVQSAEVEAKGEARARIRVHADSRPSGAPGALAFDLEGQGNEGYAVPPRKAGAPAPDRTASFQALVLRVAGDLIDGQAARLRLRDGPPSAVHAALVADAGELREEAIRAVAERQLREEVPTLLKLLGDSEETVRDAALGALIAMRDRRAVSELTRTRSLRDRREMRKIIEAIGILGGQEADEYLSFVAATHDDEEIRGVATAARARMMRRAAGGSGGTGREEDRQPP